MLRREIRERREYLFRKHKEESEAKIRDRKDKLKRALDENKPIPTELKVHQHTLLYYRLLIHTI